uniref:Sterile alpha motif domain containing 13 n=1 Tax=Chrysemys picta bellii TaxID=8478 RepID=A0A8C3INW1_CHRPI
MKKVAELKETSTLSMLSVDMENKENGSLDVKNSVENGRPPDPADWAVTDVVNYFRTAGFEEQANAFQEQVLRKIPHWITQPLILLKGMKLSVPRSWCYSIVSSMPSLCDFSPQEIKNSPNLTVYST